MMRSEKIRPEHLSRPAWVYIRQSSMGQVRNHQESRRRQYDLANHAKAMGWTQVEVVDEDLGKSGARSEGRPGFQRLVAGVSLGRAGAVFSLEVSRLARNNRDWYHLLDLCGLMNTLIVDAEGIYDPRLPNDRLLMGLKGTMSEAELGWIRQRAHEGLLAKARRGELVLGLPIGYIKTRDGCIEKTPDQRVREAIVLVLKKFDEIGSVRQVLLWFRQEQISLPVLVQDAKLGDRVLWRLPIYNTILKFLQNPIYAGAYAFGRTMTRSQVTEGILRKTRGHKRAVDEWIVLLPDHHEGYIPWERYERNQKIIADNAQMKGLMVKGAPRHGRSLLSGILRCGHCGRRMHVRYGGKGGRVTRYDCRGANINHGAGGCISFGGLRVDEAIEQEVLRVLTPGAIEAALEGAQQVADKATETRRLLELELKEARYEAERARRQYDVVEPENRLVAETLEHRWNAALERVRSLESRVETLNQAQQASVRPDRAKLLALSRDFPAVWSHPTTDPRTKKRIVRLLIEEIVTRLPAEGQIEFVIHWKGGKHSRLIAGRNRSGHHRRCTSRDLIDVIRELASTLPDGKIANILNRLGYRTGAGNSWNQTRVKSLRDYHGIKVFDRVTGDAAPLTIEKASDELGVSTATVRKMIEKKILPARQPIPCAPWAIRREDLGQEEVKAVVEAIRRRKALPRTSVDAQMTLIKSGR